MTSTAAWVIFLSSTCWVSSKCDWGLMAILMSPWRICLFSCSRSLNEVVGTAEWFFGFWIWLNLPGWVPGAADTPKDWPWGSIGNWCLIGLPDSDCPTGSWLFSNSVKNMKPSNYQTQLILIHYSDTRSWRRWTQIGGFTDESVLHLNGSYCLPITW